MKKISACILSLLLVACGGKTVKESKSADSVQQSAPTESVDKASPFALIPGMEEAMLEESGIKAWIDNEIVYWSIFDKDKYMEATETSEEFYRIGDGPFVVSGLDETPIGVYLHKMNKKGDIALYIIGHKHHVFAYDISLEVSMVGGGAGKIENLSDVEKFSEEDGKLVAVDLAGNQQDVELYNADSFYQCGLNYNGKDYYIELSTTWNIKIVVDNNDYYLGHFQQGENGYITFQITRHFTYDGDYQETDHALNPIKGAMRINNKKSTVAFDMDLFGIPQGEPIAYEVYPLFD